MRNYSRNGLDVINATCILRSFRTKGNGQMASADFTTQDMIDAMEPNMAADRATTEAAALTSIAISLKRIADAIDGKPGTTGIHELINAIEWNTREAA